jgi:hypothetical protein
MEFLGSISRRARRMRCLGESGFVRKTIAPEFEKDIPVMGG